MTAALLRTSRRPEQSAQEATENIRKRTRYRGRAVRAQHCCEVLVSWRRFDIGRFGVAAVLP